MPMDSLHVGFGGMEPGIKKFIDYKINISEQTAFYSITARSWQKICEAHLDEIGIFRMKLPYTFMHTHFVFGNPFYRLRQTPWSLYVIKTTSNKKDMISCLIVKNSIFKCHKNPIPASKHEITLFIYEDFLSRMSIIRVFVKNK